MDHFEECQTSVATIYTFWKYFFPFLNGPLMVSFSSFSSFRYSRHRQCVGNIKLADYWIRIVDLWFWKRLHYQLSHNHCTFFISLFHCDQIERFIGLWASFQSLWQQFNLPKFPTFLGNLCKSVKIFNFSSEIILGNFYRHLATSYWSHWFLCSLKMKHLSKHLT